MKRVTRSDSHKTVIPSTLGTTKRMRRKNLITISGRFIVAKTKYEPNNLRESKKS